MALAMVERSSGSILEPVNAGYTGPMSKSTLLKLGSIPCFFFAYRFASHGLTLNDNFCVTLGILSLGVGIGLAACAFWISRSGANSD